MDAARDWLSRSHVNRAGWPAAVLAEVLAAEARIRVGIGDSRYGA